MLSSYEGGRGGGEGSGRVEDSLRVMVFLGLLVTPLLLGLVAGEGGWRWLGLGAVAWGLAVAAKIPLALLLSRRLRERAPAALYAGLEGLLSAVCELGAAAAAFFWLLDEGTATHVAAFGAGAGGLEVIYVLGLALSEKFGPERPDGDAPSDPGPDPEGAMPRHVAWTFVTERWLALALHVGARGLVWLAVLGTPWLGVVAVATFALVDGLASYGQLREWDWLSLPVWKRFYGFLAVVSFGMLLLFVVLAPPSPILAG